MKILIVQDHLRSGGTERQSVLLANALAAAGRTTTLLTFRPGGALAGTVSPRVSRLTLQNFDTRLDWFAPGLRRFAASLAPDVILAMGRMANCYAGHLQAALPRAAVLGTMRTGKPLPWLFRRSLHSVCAIVANSREARDHLVLHHGVPAGKIAVIYNSLVFPDDRRPATADAIAASPRAALRAQHGATADTTVLLCVAMFRREKNQRALIELVAAMPSSPKVQLWLAGDGPARADCARLIATHGLGDRVKLLGFQRHPAALYAAADIAVHASWSESLSNFLIEAQAHGLPVVAYQAQGIEECFLPGETGWAITRDDPQAFQAALGRLFAAFPAERAARSAAARQFARTTFDPARQVNAYLALFAHLTAPQPR